MSGPKELLPYVRLRFNISHPSLEECYAYGYECALANIEEEANPYKEGTKENEYWADGWWAGFYGVDPAFKIPSEDQNKEIKIMQKVISPSEEKRLFSMNDARPNNYRMIALWTNNNLSKTLKITGVLAAAMIIVFQLVVLVN